MYLLRSAVTLGDIQMCGELSGDVVKVDVIYKYMRIHVQPCFGIKQSIAK